MSSNRRTTRRQVQGGFTIAEVLVAAGVLGLLLGLHLLLFQLGFNGWHKVEVSGSLRQQLQVAGETWVRDCLQASGNFIDVEEGALSLLSARDEDTGPDLALGTGNLIWRQSIVYYLDSQDKEFRRRALAWPTPSADAAHLSEIDFSEGERPLTYYLTGGRTLARYVDDAQFENEGGLWRLELKASQTRYGRPDQESVQAVFLARPHNF